MGRSDREGGEEEEEEYMQQDDADLVLDCDLID